MYRKPAFQTLIAFILILLDQNLIKVCRAGAKLLHILFLARNQPYLDLVFMVDQNIGKLVIDERVFESFNHLPCKALRVIATAFKNRYDLGV